MDEYCQYSAGDMRHTVYSSHAISQLCLRDNCALTNAS